MRASSKTTHIPRLLIVDDEENFRLSLCDLLEDHGFHCHSAEDGVAALQLLIQQPFEALLTDYRMPVMDGFDLKKAVTYQPALKDLPVILVSGEPNKELHRQVQQAGFAAVLFKPFDMTHLITELHRILRMEPDSD